MKNKTKLINALVALCVSATCVGFASCKTKNPDSTGSGAPSAPQFPSSAYLSDENISLLVGKTHRLTIGNGTASEWTTSNPSIATVDGGLITAVGEGIAFIRAKVGQDTLLCIVNVSSSSSPCNIVLSHSIKTMYVGDDAVITGSVSRDGAAVDEVISWSSSDSEILSLTPDGNSVLISAKRDGEVTLTATVDSSTAICRVTVKAAYNTLGSFDGCSDMASAKVTQNAFDMGSEIKTDDIESGSSVTLYGEAYSGEYTNNADQNTDALVLFATLSSSVLDKIEGGEYCRYGFLVRAAQITDSEYVGYGEKTYVYYATQGSQDGAYGVFIEGLPTGYYKAWAFVEYLDNDELVKEISEDCHRVGDVIQEVSSTLGDVSVKISDGGRWGYGTPVLGAHSNETFMDSNGIQRDALYAFDTTKTVYTGVTTGNYYYNPKLQLDLSLSKEALLDYADSGYSMLTFYVYFDPADKSWTHLSAGKIKLLDLTKFDETATDNDFEQDINKRLTTKSAPVSSWVRIQYDAALLAEYYDVLFSWKTAYPLFNYYTLQSGTLYVSGITMEKPSVAREEVSNLVTDAYTIDAVRMSYWEHADTPKTMRTNTSGGVIVQKSGQTVANRLDSTVSKKAAFKVALTEDGSKEYENTIAFTFSPEVISKSTLEDWMDAGYDYFTFSLYRQFTSTAARENPVYARQLDFKKMRENNASVSDTAVRQNYTAVGSNYFTNTWITVTYELSDLLEFYDVLFAPNTPYYLYELGTGSTGPNHALYISAFEITKVDISNIDPSNVVENASSLSAKRTNIANGDPHSSLTAKSCTDTVANRLNTGVSKKSAFKIDLGDTTSYGNALGDASVEVKMSSAAISKKVIQKWISEGYKTFNFSVYRQWTTTETWECGMQFHILDFAKMRAGTPSDEDGAIDVRNNCKFYELSGAANTWQTISYGLSDLLEFYDVIFNINSKYFLVETGVGLTGTNEVFYISPFSISKLEISDVVTDETLISAKRTNNANGDAHSSLVAKDYDENVSNRLDSSVSKKAAFKIDLGDTTSYGSALGDASVEVKLSSAAILKETIQEWISEGYKTLNFSVYRQWTTKETWECGMQITTLDFAKMRAGAPSVKDDSPTIRNSFADKKELTGASNKWQDISYNLSDLLEFYDVIFGANSKYFLAEVGVGITGTNEALYISSFALAK